MDAQTKADQYRACSLLICSAYSAIISLTMFSTESTSWLLPMMRNIMSMSYKTLLQKFAERFSLDSDKQ